MLSKIHVPSSTEITTALEPFEGFVTQLRHIYNAYQSIEFKKTVSSFFIFYSCFRC